MTKREGKTTVIDLKGLLCGDEEFLRTAVQALVQEALEAEMTEAIRRCGLPHRWPGDWR